MTCETMLTSQYVVSNVFETLHREVYVNKAIKISKLNILQNIKANRLAKMGNCLPKLKKKNKVSPDPKGLLQTKQKATVSELLSRSSASLSLSHASPNEGLEMLKDLTVSDEGSKSIESLVYQREDTIMDELKDKGSCYINHHINNYHWMF